MGGKRLAIRDDVSAAELRRLARREPDRAAAARMQAVAGALESLTRAEAARLVGMSGKPLRDAVLRYNAEGLAGLHDRPRQGRPPRLTHLLAGVASRGYLLAVPLALKLGCGFVMLRKRGKLSGAVVGLDYDLEYGTDRIEIQADAVAPGARVVVVDDLLATGGTMAAGVALLRRVSAEVPALIELTFLDGRARVDVPFESLVAYDR